MTLDCTWCKGPIRGHVLFIEERPYCRKSCYCRLVHRPVPKKDPCPCELCEPKFDGAKFKTSKTKRSPKHGRRGRAVMIAT